MAVVTDMVDIEIIPFGNCYYITTECGGASNVPYPFASAWQGYDAKARTCWDKKCGAAARKPAEDCFTGQLVCQHGVADGMVTTSWACAMDKSGGKASDYLPYVTCTSDRFLGVVDVDAFEATVLFCAFSAGFNATELLACASGDNGRDLLNEQGRKTVGHAGVPYLVVDGEVVDDTGCVGCGDGIMQKVCEAWQRRAGEVTPVCAALFGKAP